MDEDDDNIELSSHALSALKDFYSERDAHQKQFEALQARAEDDAAGRAAAGSERLSMSAFAEDWNASQFWYTDATAETLARGLLSGATAQDAVAFVSAPSAFLAAKNLLAGLDREEEEARPELVLLEFDERFGVFAEFVRFDFNKPLALPARLKGRFTRVIADPPFLNEDCQTKTALAVQWLLTASAPADNKLAICTGERMHLLIEKLYGKKGVRMTTYDVQHEKGLSNEFRLYASFTTQDWELLDHNP